MSLGGPPALAPCELVLKRVAATQPRPGEATVSSPLVPARPAVLEPLAPGRYKIQFTVSAGLRDKLERLQALMRASLSCGRARE